MLKVSKPFYTVEVENIECKISCDYVLVYFVQF